MNIIALDDEQGALKLLLRMIKSIEPDSLIDGFTDPDEAIAFSSQHRVDVAFLDIQLGTKSGLDIARKIMSFHPNVNIIFTTGYSEFALDAIELRSSGYILKPITRKALEKELTNLRRPVITSTGIYARCFGNFDLIVNGVTVNFRRKLSKEVLAYLIDLQGLEVSRRELAAVLFDGKPYSRTMQSYLTQIIKSLKENLNEVGAGHILVTGHNFYKIDPESFSSDARDFLKGNKEARSAYTGAYMEQYSWAEYSKEKFE